MTNDSISNINPIDNTTVSASVSFISICIGLIVFIKTFLLELDISNIILIILSVTTTLFGISAIISYIDIAKTSAQKIEEVLSIKFFIFLLGFALLGISAILVIYPY